MRRSLSPAAALAAALPLVAALAQAGEVALDKVPAPVLETLKARFADAEPTGAAKEKTPEGQEYYEISLDDKDHNNIDAQVTPEGTLLFIEQQIVRKELPAPVLAALDKKYAKARFRLVVRASEVTPEAEKLVHYEVLLMTPKQKLYAVQLDPEGKILSEEEQVEGEDE